MRDQIKHDADSQIGSTTGLSPKFLWQALAVAYLFAGGLQVLSWVFRLTPLELPFISYMTGGFLSVAMAPVCWLCGRRGVNALFIHIPLAISVAFIYIATYFDPNDHGADVLYPLLPMLFAVVMFPALMAAPYVLMGTAGTAMFVLLGEGDHLWPRAIVAATVALVAAGVLMVGQNQLRAVLGLNHRLAEIDALTGVANRRRFMRALDDLFAHGAVDADAVLFGIDLDKFKAVNDNFSHTLGDRQLVAVASAMRSVLVESDLIVRRGGDEFMVLVTSELERDFERLRLQLAAVVTSVRAQMCPNLNANTSVALVRRQSNDSALTLIGRCDQELAVVKGRSRADPESSDILRAVLSDDQAEAHDLAWLQSIAVRNARGLMPKPQVEVTRKASWVMVAALFAVIAVVPLTFESAIGHGRTPPVSLFIICAIAAMMSAICLYMRIDSRKTWLLSFELAVSIGMITAAILVTSHGRATLIDLYLLPTTLVFYVAGRRLSLALALTCFGLFAYFLATTHYELIAIRVTETGVAGGLIAFFVARSQQLARQVAGENENRSGRDPLTGLANVRRMRSMLEREIATSHETGSTISLLTIDLDNFKQVNDRYNYQTGDDVLVAVADAIMAGVRAQDLVVRRGGDEFVVIMSGDAFGDLKNHAARIGERISAAREAIAPLVLPTASVGYVTHQPGESADELLHRADAAERQAKLLVHPERGRDLHSVA